VGAIETAATRSSAGPQKVIILADGAKSIWGIAEEYFPGATEIVDLYHAREHLAKVAKLLYGVNTPQSQERLAARRDELDEGNVEAVIAALSGSRLGDSETQEEVQTQIEYFRGNGPGCVMPNSAARACSWDRAWLRPAGRRSSASASSCQACIGTSGAPNAIIAPRCHQLSGRWEELWESRATG